MIDELLPGDAVTHTATGRLFTVVELGTKWRVPAARVRPIPKDGVRFYDVGPREFWVPRAVLRRHAS